MQLVKLEYGRVDEVSCNVPILGHYNFTECYAYQSSQIGVTESSGDIEGFYWARLASFIIRIHSAQLGFGFVAFDDFRNFELLWVIS
jgi:hypothetical protein